jgi:hypothetical protein
MNKAKALALIQHMHETKTVTNDAVIAWYKFFAHNLPKMRPERSDVDLLRTVALWMELTKNGGSPGFLYQYRSEPTYPSIKPHEPAKPDRSWLIGTMVSICGIAALFLDWKLGVVLIVGGQLIHFIAYRIAGGPTNPNLMKDGTTLYEQEGRPVMEWASKQRSTPEGGR